MLNDAIIYGMSSNNKIPWDRESAKTQFVKFRTCALTEVNFRNTRGHDEVCYAAGRLPLTGPNASP
jgi:hypothetical protein